MAVRPSRRQRFTLVVLVLASLTFTAVDFGVDGGRAFTGLRAGTATVFGSVQRAGAAVASPVLGGVRALRSAGTDTDRLRRENSRLRAQLRDQSLNRARSRQLASLDLLVGRAGLTTVPAHVVAYGVAAGFEWTVTVDAGSRDGVGRGMTVINGAGLVGRVVGVAPTTCRVLLAIDPTAAVGSRLVGSGKLGITRGDGVGPMRLQLLDPHATVHVGDELVTGPYGATSYAPDIPIGRISAVTDDGGGVVRTARVEPYADFTALDVVAVVTHGPPRDTGVAALPPPHVRNAQ